MHNSQLNYIAGGRGRGARGGAAQCSRGVMHVLVGEAPRYKQIDHTTSGLIALQADELHYKPKVRSIRRILSTIAEKREYVISDLIANIARMKRRRTKSFGTQSSFTL